MAYNPPLQKPIPTGELMIEELETRILEIEKDGDTALLARALEMVLAGCRGSLKSSKADVYLDEHALGQIHMAVIVVEVIHEALEG